MSITRCHDCERTIDTDLSPCHWIELGNMRRMHHEVSVCEPCMIDRDAAREAEEAAAGRAMAQAEASQ